MEHIRSGILKILIINLITLIMAACAAPQIQQSVVMPANENGMQGVKKVAVLGFSGDPQQEFSVKLESFLANVKVKKKPYFTVVDRKTLDVIIREQKMVSKSGLFDQNDAVKLGKLSGVDTVMNGFVKWPNVETKTYREERQYCARQKKNGKCLQWASTTVKCTDQVSKFDMTVKAISVQKGDVVFTKNYVGEGYNKYCSDSRGQGKKLDSDLASEAINSAMNMMRQDIAPYEVVMTISLMNFDNSALADNKSAKKLFESGLEFAGKNRMDRACEKFQEATSIYDKSPALYHNLGVCAEVKGDLNEALRLHKQADSLLDKPNDTISAALDRVTNKMKNRSAVAAQSR